MKKPYLTEAAGAAGERTPGHPLNRHLFITDNLHLLRGLKSESIDLVVTDPPFGTSRTFTAEDLKDPLRKDEMAREQKYLSDWGVADPDDAEKAGIELPPEDGTIRWDDIWEWTDTHDVWADRMEGFFPVIRNLVFSARDTHSDGYGAYLSYMAPRLIEIERVLKPTGSIYLHCDPSISPYLRMLMDAVFGGKDAFRNEITWNYGSPGRPKHWFPRKHDTILFYAKAEQRPLNYDEILVPHKRIDKKLATGGWRKGQEPPVTPKEELLKGKAPFDWWEGIAPAYKMANEHIGYPTQKPVKLAERIILASSKPGDVVLDPFAGCAYVPVAAERRGRQWIASDISVRALTIVKRQFNRFEYAVEGEVMTDAEGNPKQRLLSEVVIEVMGPNQVPKRDPSKEAETPPPPAAKPPKKEPPKYGKRFSYTREQGLRFLLESSGWMCWGCGQANRRWDGTVLEDPRNFERDHIDPKNSGGAEVVTNWAPLCRGCNGMKGLQEITLRELRRQVVKEGLLMVESTDDLPDLGRMLTLASNWHGEQMRNGQ